MLTHTASGARPGSSSCVPCRAGRVEHDVGRGEQRVERGVVGRERRDVLARVPRAWRCCRCSTSPVGRDDTDDGRAEIAEHPRRPGRRLAAEIDDAQACQQPLRHALQPPSSNKLTRTSAKDGIAMAKYEVVDADCHILEPPDIWTNWLSSKYQDKAPKLVKDPRGRRRLAHRGRRRPRSDRSRRDARACRSTSSAGTASPTKRRAPVATTARPVSPTWTSTVSTPRSCSRRNAR